MSYRKYRAIKTEIDGIIFDSKAEARRYQELKLMERQGLINSLKLQPCYELIPPYQIGDRKVRKTTYKADFEYIENGQKIIEDVKGVKTDVYKLKKKLFEYLYKPLEIREVK